jgi:hypothetical protein
MPSTRNQALSSIAGPALSGLSLAFCDRPELFLVFATASCNLVFSSLGLPDASRRVSVRGFFPQQDRSAVHSPPARRIQSSIDFCVSFHQPSLRGVRMAIQSFPLVHRALAHSAPPSGRGPPSTDSLNTNCADCGCPFSIICDWLFRLGVAHAQQRTSLMRSFRPPIANPAGFPHP